MCLCDRMKGVICATHQRERDERYPVPQPLTWAVPDQPGREVTAVRDRYGRWWEREHEHGPTTVWVLYSEDRAEAVDGRFWRNLIHEVGPLTDATGEVA